MEEFFELVGLCMCSINRDDGRALDHGGHVRSLLKHRFKELGPYHVVFSHKY